MAKPPPRPARRKTTARPTRATDSRPRRSSDSRPARAGDSRPRRDGDSRSARAGDSRPRRDGDSRSARAGDSRPRRDGDSRPARAGDSRPRRDGDSRPRRSSDSRPARAGRPRRDNDSWNDDESISAPKSWGGVARRGVSAATGKRVRGASTAWREAVEASGDRKPTSVRRAAVPDEATDAKQRSERAARANATTVRRTTGGTRPAPKKRLPDPAPIDLAGEVREQLARAVGTAKRERVERRLSEAAEHFEAERFADAARILKKLVDEAPTVAAVHELYGLTLYRQEKWKLAARELEAFRLLTNSTEEHPVLADCYRALRQWAQVEELWDELRETSPSAELVTEGRIVMAGSLADRGEVRAAISLLEKGFTYPKRALPHHLRRAYALADLYERAGELPKARALFEKIERTDPDFADVKRRVRALR